MIDCTKCGHSNSVEANFCSNCGQKLHDLSGETTAIIPMNDDELRAVELTGEDAQAVRELPAGNALLIVTRGPDVGARYLLDSAETTVGRSPKADIFLNDITVSRHHAKFTVVDGQMRVTDEHSHNGTYVNRTLVDDTAVLRPGDEVQIGKYRMTYFVSEHGLR